jgi:hypothetical protein
MTIEKLIQKAKDRDDVFVVDEKRSCIVVGVIQSIKQQVEKDLIADSILYSSIRIYICNSYDCVTIDSEERVFETAELAYKALTEGGM